MLKKLMVASFVASLVTCLPTGLAIAQLSPAKQETQKAHEFVEKLAAETAEKKAKAAEARSARRAKAQEKKAAAKAARKAAHERQAQCSTEWKAARAAGKIEKGMIWPRYWAECDKRLMAKRS